MKKALLASTAIIAAAAIASPANAADRIKLSVGGYMAQYIGFADNEDDTGVREFATFDEHGDAEIYFSGSTTLDNGIKLTARMELEGDAGAGGVDESWLVIQTPAWGSIEVGADDVAADAMAVEPQKGISNNSDNWVRDAVVALNDDSYSVGGSGDDNMVFYTTPSIAGFQAGISYTPDIGTNGGGNVPNRVGSNGSAISGGLLYKTSISDVGIEAGYTYYKEGGDSPANSDRFVSHQGGLNVTFGGFGIGGAYGRHMGSDEVAGDDAHIYKAGVWYKSGPLGIGFLHRYEQTDVTLGDNGAEAKASTTSVWADYLLSDGVKWQGMIFNADYDTELGVDATEAAGGWGVVTGLRLDF